MPFMQCRSAPPAVCRVRRVAALSCRRGSGLRSPRVLRVSELDMEGLVVVAAPYQSFESLAGAAAVHTSYPRHNDEGSEHEPYVGLAQVPIHLYFEKFHERHRRSN